MDKYAVYHNIKSVQAVLAQYPEAEDISNELTALAQQLSSRTYRVAVIGEFKRGKSSLVNCILGTEILPTDILPTTAVVNRIVYGTEQKIEICYKNGTTETTTVADLAEYATKKNEANAAQIREIVVHYPSVFCQNNIELLDTPGLNDDEFMDKTTLDVLDKIDTAIVATHASYPVSDTEKKLICRLIEQDDIYHLTFVATFIDRVSDEPEEQDQIVELVRSRLAVETYQMFCGLHPDEPGLLEKAQRILCNPVVFAVSSRLAMRGFVNGNKKMLDESRFPHFKYELSALLTANQELDLQMKAARLIRVANENFDSWHKQLLTGLDATLAESRNVLKKTQTYQKTGCEGLMNQMAQLDDKLRRSSKFNEGRSADNSELVRNTSWVITRNLLQLDPKTVNVGDIENALQNASAELECLTDRQTEQLIHEWMQKVNDYLIASEKSCGLSGDILKQRLEQWKSTTPFPQLDIHRDDLRKMFDDHVAQERIRSANAVVVATWVKQIVGNKLYAAHSEWQKQIWAYIASWRSQLLKQNLADKEKMGQVSDHMAQQIRECFQKKEAATVNYTSNRGLLEQAERELGSIL